MAPLYSHDSALNGNERFRVMGPFFESQSDTNGNKFIAVRPFYSNTRNPEGNRDLRDYLWPVAMNKDYLKENYWRFIFWFGHDFNTEDNQSRYRVWLLPFVFWGLSENNDRYFAFFPLGGTIREFMGQDKTCFVLFPLYGSSSINDVRSQAVLWPFIAWSKTDKKSSWRVFPFYGTSSVEDQWHKQFVLWPIWTQAKYFYKEQEGGGFILFPLFGRMKLADQKAWYFLPPFIKFAKNATGTSVNLPWPFIQYSTIGENKFFIWPLWGRKKNDHEDRSFYLWPLIWKDSVYSANKDTYSLNVMPLIYYQSYRPADENKINDKNTGRYFKLWPLVSYLREGETARLRTLDLWPLKQSGAFERNLSPIWSLYTHTIENGWKEDELLWGFYKYRRNAVGDSSVSIFPLFSYDRVEAKAGKRSWRLLGGLIGCEREGIDKEWQLLYVIRF